MWAVILRDNWFMSSYVFMNYETLNSSYTGFDSHFNLVQVSDPYVIWVIYAPHTMGAVRVLRYREENYSYFQKPKQLRFSFKLFWALLYVYLQDKLTVWCVVFCHPLTCRGTLLKRMIIVQRHAQLFFKGG